MPFLMIRNDITKVQADALVNPANEELLEGSGTSRAIYLAAGEEDLATACREIGHCSLGKAVITKAFNLDVKYIIHAVGPVWIDGEHDEEKYLYSAYMESMLLAKEYHLESIAFPLLSSGNYGYPKELAMKTAIHAISDFLMKEELLVYLVLYDRSAVTISKKLFTAVEEYIDDHYVEQKDESIPKEEERSGFLRRAIRRRSSYEEHTSAKSAVMGQNADFAGYEALERRSRFPKHKESVKSARSPEHKILEEDICFSPAPKRSLDDLLSHMDETFSQMLLRLIDERGLKDSYVYKKANIDRRLFSKIRNDMYYAPNKKTVFAFSIALELSLDETKDLLMRAGFAFSRCSKFDVIICYFIENRKYDIFEINEMLFAYGQPLLGE